LIQKFINQSIKVSQCQSIGANQLNFIKVVVFLFWHKPPQIWNESWPSSSGLRGHRRTYLTILKRAWSANFKMVWYVLLRYLRPKLDSQDPFHICGGLCQTRKTSTFTEFLLQWSHLARSILYVPLKVTINWQLIDWKVAIN
jgi:hypothetical protein